MRPLNVKRREYCRSDVKYNKVIILNSAISHTTLSPKRHFWVYNQFSDSLKNLNGQDKNMKK